MITPSPENLRIGAGNCFWGSWAKDSDDILRFSGRHLGNVESCTIHNEATEIDKQSSMEGARGIYASAITLVKGTVGLVLSELDRENVALAFLATPKAFTQDGITATDRDVNDGDPVELDKWYDLGGFNAAVASVSQGGPDLDPTADYEVNVPAGLIRILSSGAGTAIATTWTGTVPDLSGKQVSGLDTPRITGALRIVDAVDMVTGIKGVLDVWKLQLAPNGDVEFISEDWAKLTMQGKIMNDTTRAQGDRYYRWVPLNEVADVSS